MNSNTTTQFSGTSVPARSIVRTRGITTMFGVSIPQKPYLKLVHCKEAIL